jgi:alkylation response protein AidB-like acyl-CoA dehydrogenase
LLNNEAHCWAASVYLNEEIIMDFRQQELTEQVAATARDFARQYIKPHVMDWDESQAFPVELFKELGKLGLMGILVPEQVWRRRAWLF